jgi:hypothetical protein
MLSPVTLRLSEPALRATSWISSQHTAWRCVSAIMRGCIYEVLRLRRH